MLTFAVDNVLMFWFELLCAPINFSCKRGEAFIRQEELMPLHILKILAILGYRKSTRVINDNAKESSIKQPI